MIEKFLQEHSCSCGIASLRTVFYNLFGIEKDEESLINLAEDIYKYKSNGNPILDEYKIKEYGTDVYHFLNLAEHFGLKTFSDSKGNVDLLKSLIDSGAWPIIHRRSDEEDNEGHYVLIYGYDNGSIYVFDPAGPDHGLMEEPYELFYNKWEFSDEFNDKERWFIFFYKNL